MPKLSSGAALFALVSLSAALCAAPPAKDNPLSQMGATGEGIRGSLPDPKLPGKLLWRFSARSLAGVNSAGGLQGTLLGVDATFFQKGAPAARLLAPKVQMDGTKKRVAASGRVKMTALAKTQKGTSLTADRLIWYAAINKVVALGHVLWKDGKTGATVEAPGMVADTKLETIHSSSGIQGTFPKGF